MNWFGLRVSGRVQLVIAGRPRRCCCWPPRWSRSPTPTLGNLTPFAPHGWLAVGSAAALLVWAFAGWEAVTSLSAEYRNPARDIGRATGIAIAVISVLYLGIAFATVAVLGDHPGKAPLSDLLVLGFGEAARPVDHRGRRAAVGRRDQRLLRRRRPARRGAGPRRLAPGLAGPRLDRRRGPAPLARRGRARRPRLAWP